jgi:excisionase family DNA binding protein
MLQHKDGNKPLFSLTVAEFVELVNGVVQDALTKREQFKLKVLKETPDEDQTFNIAELAGFLKCSKVTVHKYKKRGMPFYRVGRKILFRKNEVLDFMRTARNKKVVVLRKLI